MLGFIPNINATVVYNFMKPLNWSRKGQWGFYAGPGMALGYGIRDNYFDAGFVAQLRNIFLCESRSLHACSFNTL